MRSTRLSAGILLAVSCSLSVNCSGQQPQALPKNDVIVPNVNGVFLDPVLNEPFSATVEAVSEQKLSDGSLNVLHTINHIARDSQGRTHNERRRFVANSFKDEPPMQSFHIYDPVTGRDTRLDPYTLVAQQVVLTTPPTPGAGIVPVTSTSKPAPNVISEELGTRTYESLTLKGVRESWPSGMTNEYWYSPDLSIYVIRVHTDAKWKQTITVTHIERSEPDPSLFVVPETYKIVDGTPAPKSGPGPDGLYQIGGGVSAPQVIQTADPEFTDAARRAKFGGVCIVAVVVDPQGMPQNVHVVRPLGKGLDEKAVEAVKK